jgi:CRP-like cAMP-binding protein
MDKDKKECASVEDLLGNLAACAFVESNHLFKKVSREDLEPLYNEGSYVYYSPNDVIFKEGDPGKDLFVIVSGTVQVTTKGKKGVVELAHLTRGAFLGEVGILTEQPRTATVVALSDVEMIKLPGEKVREIMNKYPRVKKLMQTVMEGRIRTVIEKQML